MSDKLKIALVMSSTRDGRLNDRVAQFVRNAIEKDHIVEILDPLEMDLPATQQSMNFLFNPSAVPQNIKDFNEKVKGYEAFVFVCAEYNWSMPPALTNMFDNIPPVTTCWKPCGFVNYSMGAFGGTRSAVQLRTYTGALGMIPVPKQVAIPEAHEKVTPEGEVKDEKVVGELNILLEHVYWAAHALKSYGQKVPPPAWAPS